MNTLVKISFLTLTCIGCINFNAALAQSAEEKAHEIIEDAADKLKKAVTAIGEDFASIQNYLDRYEWKAILEDETNVGPLTIKQIRFNDHSRGVIVKPGERINISMECILDPSKCAALDSYRIVMGIKDKGPQASFQKFFGGETQEHVALIAPSEPGLYQIRFRLTEAVLETTAFDQWLDKEGKGPGAACTIGFIIVQS